MSEFKYWGFMKTYQSIGSYAVLGLAAVWSLISILGNRALVMGDELIFYRSVLVEPLAAQNPAGYLYDIVYSSAALCGDGYYACVKTINWLFLIGFAGVLVALALYLGINRIYAVLFGAAVLLSPIGVRTSFFMPDVMFYAFAVASIALVFVWLERRDDTRLLIVSALVAGGAMLVKPHGVFLIIGIILSLIFLKFFELRSLLKPLAIYAGIAFGFRLIVGFIAGGASGLNLFGGYASDGAVSALTGSIETATQESRTLDVAVGFAVFALLGFLAGLLILSPGLFGALIQTENGKIFSSKLSTQKSFLYFSLLLFLSQAAAFTVFIFMAASGGESFANRVVFRYVEFLVPLIAIAILASYLREKTKFRITIASFVFLGLTVGAIVYSLSVFGDGINIRYADSGFTFLFSDREILTGAIVLLVAVSMLQFLGVETVIRRATYISFLLLFPALGLYTNITLANTTQTLAPLDEGAEALKIAFELDPTDDVYVIAPSKGEAQYLQMRSGLVYSDYLVSATPGVGEAPIESEEAWVLSVGNVEFFESDGTYRQSGANYSLERISNKEIHYFGKNMIDSPLASTTGVTNLNSRLAWFGTESPRLSFTNDLSSYRSITFTIMVANTLSGGDIEASVGDEVYSFPIPQTPGQLSRVAIEFDGSQSGNEIVFSDPERSIVAGMGIQSIELNR